MNKPYMSPSEFKKLRMHKANGNTGLCGNGYGFKLTDEWLKVTCAKCRAKRTTA